MFLHPSTIQLLRFHFSLFLLPVYLFALSQAPQLQPVNALLLFIILHLMVYPASNGYNSYMDRDTTAIGGLAQPMQPTKQLFYVTIALDVMATALAFLISPLTAAGVLLYIIASRAYSYRGIRLKQYPVIGFLTVFIFQGALVFFITWQGVAGTLQPFPWTACIMASLLIGALYPLTQVYQHEADKEDGVQTISMLLGKRGSFLFSMLQFVAAAVLAYFYFNRLQHPNHFYLFLLYTLPVVLFFLYWMRRVWKNETQADFSHSLRMNILSMLCTSAYFITLIMQNH